MPRTKKPCPGCGEVPFHFRDADKVCKHCQDLLELAKTISVRRSSKKFDIVRLPHAPHGLPYIYHGNPRGYHRDYSDDSTLKYLDLFRRTFFDLHDVLGERVIADIRGILPIVPKTECMNYETATSVKLPKGAADLLCKLYVAAEQMVEGAYQEGYRDGHDLIGGLADGRVSIQEFNDKTLGKEDED